MIITFGGMGWSFSGITAQGATFWLFGELIPITCRLQMLFTINVPVYHESVALLNCWAHSHRNSVEICV